MSHTEEEIWSIVSGSQANSKGEPTCGKDPIMIVKYQYPGDPVALVDLMFGLEFKLRHPDREIVVQRDNQPSSLRIPVSDSICDSCGSLVADLQPCAVTQHHLYCWGCFDEWIGRYVVVEAI